MNKPVTKLEPEAEQRVVALLQEAGVELVVLAGWMRLLSLAFLSRFPGQVINLHPALPGMFPGAHAIDDALAAYTRGEITHTGVMVHRVPDEGVDNGPVLAERGRSEIR